MYISKPPKALYKNLKQSSKDFRKSSQYKIKRSYKKTQRAVQKFENKSMPKLFKSNGEINTDLHYDMTKDLNIYKFDPFKLDEIVKIKQRSSPTYKMDQKIKKKSLRKRSSMQLSAISTKDLQLINKKRMKIKQMSRFNPKTK